MQTSRPDLMEGSGRPIVTVNAWRGGKLVASSLTDGSGQPIRLDVPLIKISDGTLRITAGQAIRSNLDLTIIDPTGTLTPKADGALSPYGSEIELRGGHKVGGRADTVPLGWYRIGDAEPDQPYRIYTSDIDATPIYVPGPSTVVMSAPDRADKVQRDLLVNGEQPVKSTVLAEIARLLQGVVPWSKPSIADKPLAAGAVTYDSDRLQACMDLADLMACDMIFTPSGAATLVRKVQPLVSVWDLPRGSTSVVGSIKSKMSNSDVHNAVIAKSSDFAGQPLIGKAFDYTAGIAWGGPYGRVPLVIDAPLAGTQPEVDQAARDELAMEQRRRWQVVTVECVNNFALEVGDVVTIPMPKAKVLGQVTSASWPLTYGLMTLTIAVDPFVWDNAQ